MIPIINYHSNGIWWIKWRSKLNFFRKRFRIKSTSVDTNYVLDANGGAIFTKVLTFTSNDFNKGHLTVRNTTASQGAFLDSKRQIGGSVGVIASRWI